KFATRLRNDLVVKSSSILRSPEGPYVLVVADDRRTLTKRAVEIGNMLYGYASVVSGLRENEFVAAKYTFFLDAERRLRGAVAPSSPASSRGPRAIRSPFFPRRCSSSSGVGPPSGPFGAT